MKIEHLAGEVCIKSSKIIGFGLGKDSSARWLKIYIDQQDPLFFRCGDMHTAYSLNEEQYRTILADLKRLNIENL